jgi:hypothetical protein
MKTEDGVLCDITKNVKEFGRAIAQKWERRFESCLGHGCVFACFCVVLSCVGRGLASG